MASRSSSAAGGPGRSRGSRRSVYFQTMGGMDRIELRGMSFQGRHGVRDAERESPQEFRVDIEVEADLRGTRVIVDVDGRVDRTVPALGSVVEDSGAPDPVKKLALDAIGRLARAEAQIHGVPEAHVHLHELGGADTLVDIVGAFWLLHALEVDRVYASPLPAPRGLKGEMPLPAPASLRVLEGTGSDLQPSSEAV